MTIVKIEEIAGCLRVTLRDGTAWWVNRDASWTQDTSRGWDQIG